MRGATADNVRLAARDLAEAEERVAASREHLRETMRAALAAGASAEAVAEAAGATAAAPDPEQDARA